jgi:dCMP deaminase
MFNRLSRNEYYMKLAEITAQRTNCIKRGVGCVIVKDDRIISIGYNGTPKNTLNCYEGGCERCNDKLIPSGEKLDLCKCLHAEENALLFCDFFKTENSVMYITHFPCLTCSKKIIQAGVKQIYYLNHYNDNRSMIYLQNSGIDCVKFD